MGENRTTTRLRQMAADDSGMALALVMLTASIMFLLVMTLLMLVQYRETQTSYVTERTQGMYVADAGINEYMSRLSANYSFYRNPNGTMRSLSGTQTQTSDGDYWTVTPSLNASGTLLLTSVGTLQDNGHTRTLKVTVRFPNWSRYVVAVDQGPYSIGAGATFDGDIRCNGDISNSGVITGLAEAGGTCSYGTSYAYNYPGGHVNGAKTLDFSQLTNDLSAMKTTAQNSGTYYAASGQLGYNVILSGASATVYKVSAVNKNKPRTGVSPADPPLGTLTQTLVGTKAIPADGVFFFDDDVWVTGNYSAAVTIASNQDIYCPGNLVPTSTDSNATCGIVAQGQVLFPWWYDTMPDDQVVQAALMSQTAGVGPEAPSGLKQYNTTTKGWTDTYTMGTSNYKNSVTIKGARAMVKMIGFSAGYDIRNFNKDPILANNPPPMYPMIAGDSLGIDRWLEN